MTPFPRPRGPGTPAPPPAPARRRRPRPLPVLLLALALLASGTGAASVPAPVEDPGCFYCPEAQEALDAAQEKAERGAQVDEDRDGLGDRWTRGFGEYAALLLASADLDGDGLGTLQEYRWDTLPLGPVPDPVGGGWLYENARDFDADGWEDGPEVAYWNDPANDAALDDAVWSGALLAPTDPDAARDLDRDGLPDARDPDADGDGLRDGQEVRMGAYPGFADSDCSTSVGACPAPGRSEREATGTTAGTGDGVPDAAELAAWVALLGPEGWKTDCDGDGIPPLRDPDSDNDGLPDGEEMLPAEGAASSDPCVADGDGDGLQDGEERAYGTDPRRPDTDADGMPDGWEASHGLQPLVAADAGLDPDADLLPNLAELQWRTDPKARDTDRDLLSDGDEAARGSDPAAWDSDGDRMPDGWEDLHGLLMRDPSDARDDPDLDRDEATGYAHANLDEYMWKRPAGWDEALLGPWTGGTDPQAPDTDLDGAPDGAEVVAGTDPRAPGSEVKDRDPDQDGLDTATELALHTRPALADTDGDGLCDGGRAPSCLHPRVAGGNHPGERVGLRADPLYRDTDGDGLDDAAEVALFDPTAQGALPDADGDGLDPLQDPDADDDGLTDAEEVTAGTRADLADTDADGLSDAQERVELRWPGHAPDPLRADTDGDGLPDGTEVTGLGTHPNLVDTDGDGLSDGDEARRGTSALSEDTDGDRMPDGWEARFGLDPRRDDAKEDPDADGVLAGLLNVEEFLLGTDPTRADTDGDGLNDQWESLLGLDPLADDRAADGDRDGLPNLGEAALGTSPHLADTDGDGLSDGWEAGTQDATLLAAGLFRADPRAYDTDADGLDDGRERALWDALGAAAWATDFDGDGVPLAALSHNLRDADADGDRLDDGQELLLLGTAPHAADTDGDGDDDFQEIMALGTDPRDPASHHGTAARPAGDAKDTDGDKLSDAAEAGTYGTDPAARDTDGDGLPDGDERIAWGRAWAADPDGDGAPNLLDPDADDDGISDAVEFATAGLDRRRFYVTSPALRDTDGDGLADGEEDGNGPVVEATAGASLATPMDGVVQGAFGLRLRETGASGPKADRGEGHSRPAPDATDTDRDGLPDGEEARRGTAWDSRDTDGDGLLDGEEPYADPDQDGLVNALDADADDDGLPDGDEKRSHTSPYDADTDDDALCDGEEARSDPLDPDSDADGLSDGQETRRAGPCLTPRGVGGWTRGGALPGGRPAFQPWLGDPAPAPAQPVTGLLPVQAPDFDQDGVLDGLEDWDADGVLDPGEMDPFENDQDGDGLADGVEVRVWGASTMTFASFLRHHDGSAEKAREAVAFHPGVDWAKTDPARADTDGDGIGDGDDLDPNGMAPPVLSLVFDSFSMLDPIDPWGSYAPEPYFDVTVQTAAGDVTLRTPILPEVPLEGPGDAWALGEAFGAGLLAGSEKTGSLPALLAGVEGGALRIRLPDDVTKMARFGEGQGVAALDEVRWRLGVGDADGWWCACDKDDSDVIDLDGASASSVKAEVRMKLGNAAAGSAAKPAPRKVVPPAQDGSLDGASTWSEGSNADDDGRLVVHVEDHVVKAFFENASSRALSGFVVQPPSVGQGWG